MAYSYGEPRYGIGFSLRGAGEESGGSKTINYVDSYVLKCNMDIEAAEVAYNAMSK